MGVAIVSGANDVGVWGEDRGGEMAPQVVKAGNWMLVIMIWMR